MTLLRSLKHCPCTGGVRRVRSEESHNHVMLLSCCRCGLPAKKSQVCMFKFLNVTGCAGLCMWSMHICKHIMMPAAHMHACAAMHVTQCETHACKLQVHVLASIYLFQLSCILLSRGLSQLSLPKLVLRRI